MEGQPEIPSTDSVKLPVWIEAVVVGGLGFVVYFAHPVGHAVWDTVNLMRPRIKKVYNAAKGQIVRRWEPLNRKRKQGSVIRVVASLLPNCLFEPPTRIYIVPNPINLEEEKIRAEYLYGEESAVLEIGGNDVSNFTALDGGLIVGFNLDTWSNSTNEDEDFEGTEVWEQRLQPTEVTIPGFLPGESSVFVSCSTPEPSGLRNAVNLDESFTTQSDDFSVVLRKNEIDDLKEMILTLMNRATVQDQTIATLQQSVVEHQNLTPTPVSIPVPMNFISANVQNKSSVPPPPPPPPPPMPLMPLLGSQPLIATKKCRNDSAPIKKAVPAMSDVLKDLPKAKNNLRKIARSPGGTPMKQDRKSGGHKDRKSNDLQSILKKRFADIHGSDDSDDDEDFTDKENHGFDDSFEPSTTTALKRNLFASPSSKKRLENDKPNRRSLGTKGNFVFGQHLLKPLSQIQATGSNGAGVPSDGFQCLRERNQ